MCYKFVFDFTTRSCSSLDMLVLRLDLTGSRGIEVSAVYQQGRRSSAKDRTRITSRLPPSVASQMGSGFSESDATAR